MVMTDAERLAAYLAEHTVSCPQCGQTLRGVRGRRCPECGLELSLAVIRHGPRAGSRRRFAAGGLAFGLATVPAAMLVWSMATWGPQSRIDHAGLVRVMLFAVWSTGLIGGGVWWINAAPSLAWGSVRAHRLLALACWAVPVTGLLLALAYGAL